MSASDIFLLAVAVAAVSVAAVAAIQRRRVIDEARRAASTRAAALAERNALEAELAVARGQLDALGEAALDGLLLLDDERRVLWANQAAWEVLGAERPGVGQSFMAAAQDVELNQAVVDALSGGRSIVRQTAVDGRTLRIRAVPVAGGAAVAVEDVTELQRLGRARRDVVANISHDLRTPLANIGLAAQTLRHAPGNETIRQHMLDQIESSVQTLSQLSQEMMDLAQIESGKVLLKLLPLPLSPLLLRVVQLLQPQIDLKGQSISVTGADGVTVLADEQQVGRVVGNLLHNAIKFASEGGALRIEVAVAGAEDAQVCVIDDGPGIPVVEQSRVFERFYKADHARSRGGTGLGLAIARHIVEGHGGRIWVESVPGQGASFCFTLPLA